MDISQFKETMKTDIKFDDNTRREIISKSLKRCDWRVKTVIIMEELSELIKAVSKSYRAQLEMDNNEDIYYGLIEEMADVRICMEFLKDIFNISESDLEKAIDIKLQRESKRCE